MSESTPDCRQAIDAECLAAAAELACRLRSTAYWIDFLLSELDASGFNCRGERHPLFVHISLGDSHAASLRGIADALAPEDNEHWVLTGEALTLAMEKFNESDCKRIDEQFNS